jgi:hypothetical protein
MKGVSKGEAEILNSCERYSILGWQQVGHLESNSLTPFSFSQEPQKGNTRNSEPRAQKTAEVQIPFLVLL